jgi:MoaA/NifB/PqqE/SkfB family radical SAM enzyme
MRAKGITLPIRTEDGNALRKRRIEWARKAREFGLAVKALASTRHPIAAHVIPIRRCNLACAYCNEYDDFSPPVPTAEMLKRIDLLAALGLSSFTFSGGEPLLHPDLDQLIRRVRQRGMLAGVITNGFLLNEARIAQLNDAGLDYLQISIDNVAPDDVSLKSLKTLDSRLIMLAQHAEFHVNINSVLGAGVRNPEDALTVTRRAVELNLTTTVGIIHDGDGQSKAVGELERQIYQQIRNLAKGSYSRINQHNPYQQNLLAGKANNWWWCRAGGRYLYICEDGLVHYCSQQRGYPGIPLENYSVKDIRREYLTKKACAPYCTISCVHQTSIVDRWRDPQTFEFSSAPKSLVAIEPLPKGPKA